MKYLQTPILFVMAAVAQWWVSSHGRVFGLAPQVLLVLTVGLAARRGPVTAMTFGFFWGLFLDLFSANLFGANALVLTLIGYGTGSVRRQIDVTGLAPQCIIVVLASFLYFLALGLIGLIFQRTFIWLGWSAFLFTPLYNSIAACILYFMGALDNAWGRT